MYTYYRREIILGDDTLIAVTVRENLGKPMFIRVHENEDAAGLVGRQIASEGIGTFVNLVHTGERLVTFSKKNQAYTFDPNRIFSPYGIQQTLVAADGKSVPASVYMEVTWLGEMLVSLRGDRSITALHNNKGDDYTLASYEEGGSEYLADTRLHVADGDYRNFVVTTREDIFEKLRDAGVSVVFQEYSPANDDGSLSVYCAKHGIPYCNIEAAYEAEERQYEIARIVAQVY